MRNICQNKKLILMKKAGSRTICQNIHTFMESPRQCQAFRDHLTLLLGRNVAGFKLKPFLMYPLENPRAFKNVSNFPFVITIIRKPGNSSIVWRLCFNCLSQAREYCRQNNIPFQLILARAPGHPQRVCDTHPDVKVVYSLPNTTTL